jgi:Flp pilus assembly pilin Flp
MTAGIPRHIVARSSQVIKEEVGQTTVETLMIVGLMAAVIVTVFTVLFWPSVSGAVTALVLKISTAISGGGIG